MPLTYVQPSQFDPAFSSVAFRNRIDNGNMEIAQRTLPVTTSGFYSLDRWIAGWSGGTASISQQVGGAGYSSRKQLYGVFTGLAGGASAWFAHKIESARSNDLAGTTVTLQFNTAFQNTGTGATVSLSAWNGTALPLTIGSLGSFTWTGLSADL